MQERDPCGARARLITAGEEKWECRAGCFHRFHIRVRVVARRWNYRCWAENVSAWTKCVPVRKSLQWRIFLRNIFYRENFIFLISSIFTIKLKILFLVDKNIVKTKQKTRFFFILMFLKFNSPNYCRYKVFFKVKHLTFVKDLIPNPATKIF